MAWRMRSPYTGSYSISDNSFDSLVLSVASVLGGSAWRVSLNACWFHVMVEYCYDISRGYNAKMTPYVVLWPWMSILQGYFEVFYACRSSFNVARDTCQYFVIQKLLIICQQMIIVPVLLKWSHENDCKCRWMLKTPTTKIRVTK